MRGGTHDRDSGGLEAGVRLGREPRPAGSVWPRPQRRRKPSPAGVPEPTAARGAASSSARGPAGRRPGPELPPSRDLRQPLRAAPEGRGREAATRGRPKACSQPRVGSRGSGHARGGGVRFGTADPGAASLHPTPPRAAAPSRAGPRSRAAGLCPGERPGSARAPRPGRGRRDGGGRRGGAGTTFRVRPRPAPCPRAAERSALRRRRQDTATPARLIRGPCAAPF